MENGFEERRKRNEDKWALDQELRFKALVRRNKLLGDWAAAELGLGGAAADAYAREVVAAEIHAGGALGKVTADFTAHGRDPAPVRLKMVGQNRAHPFLPFGA